MLFKIPFCQVLIPNLKSVMCSVLKKKRKENKRRLDRPKNKLFSADEQYLKVLSLGKRKTFSKALTQVSFFK